MMREVWMFILILLGLLASMHCTAPDENPTKPSTALKSVKPLFESVPLNHSGLTFRNDVTQTHENNHIINVEFISGAGVAVGDINGDLLPDLFFTANQSRDRLYLNLGELKFKDITEEAGIIDSELWSTGVTYVDIDLDGDQDIYVCRNVYLEDHLSANHLYINNGDLTFTEKAAEFGLADNGFSVQAIFFDYNKDQLIDMYLVNQPPSLAGQGGQLDMSMAENKLFSDKLYQNIGGVFKDVTDQAGLRNFAFGLSASVGDLNNDSWPDLYVANDFDVPDHLYINQQDGSFKNEIWTATKHISNFSMGSDIADYDNDGNLDIVVLDMMAEDHHRIKSHMGSMQPEAFWKQVQSGGHFQYMFNTLQRNNGNGTFSDLAQLAGITNTDWSWAPLLADFDNDGFKDLFVSNGVSSNNRFSDLTDTYQEKLDSINNEAYRTGKNPQDMIDVLEFAKLAPRDKLPNYVFKNNGDYSFTKKVEEWGLSEKTLSNGSAYADLDLDGDLELIINNIDDEALLYRNTAVEGGANHFIRFELVPNQGVQLYGTRISIYRDGKIWQLMELANARGYMSKSESIAHFGLGDDVIVEEVVIDWADGQTTRRTNMPADQIHTIEQDGQAQQLSSKRQNVSEHVAFQSVEEQLGLSGIQHIENKYDDYAKEILLPHKMSEFGPSIAIGDANGDGLEDFFLGGSAGHAGRLFVQEPSGRFSLSKNAVWAEDSACEDMGCAFLDVDGNGHLDLFVVSGGNEFSPDSPLLQDRLYLNNGTGSYERAMDKIPNYLAAGSCARPFDFDLDGDMDLFVGGRLVPGRYPIAADSYLLENRGGVFTDVTDERAPELKALGMVTSASWSDINGDDLVDLLIVGEWMPITTLLQSPSGSFSLEQYPDLAQTTGWYYSVTSADMDNDGDQDIITGNLGLNYKFKASVDEPFQVHSHDFDDNGHLDIVLSYYEHGEVFPVRGKDCSTQQIPSFGERFETYNEFASSNLLDLYGASLSDALHLEAQTFASAYIENKGEGQFTISPLPALAQVSSINAIRVLDVNEDRHKDIVICGNLFQSEIETPRNDAGNGLVLLGNGKGNFNALSTSESGFYAPGDAKDMALIHIGGKKVFLIGNNNDRLQALMLDHRRL